MWIFYDNLSYDVEKMLKDLPSYVLNTKYNFDCKIPYLYVDVDITHEGNMLIFSDKYFHINKNVLSHYRAPAREIITTVKTEDLDMLIDSALYKRMRNMKRISEDSIALLVPYESFHESKPWFIESIPLTKKRCTHS